MHANKYNYYISYFDKVLAESVWKKEMFSSKRDNRHDPVNYKTFLDSGGYSECWSMDGQWFDTEHAAILCIKQHFSDTDARVRRILITGTGEDDWDYANDDYDGWDNFLIDVDLTLPQGEGL